MLKERSELAHAAATIIVVLTVIAAGGGFFFPDAYRDSAVYGNDFVTLVVAAPLLATASIYSRRGSRRARLVWLGMLYFTSYNYAFYLFGAALNWFFLLYVALFTLPILVLIFALVDIDIDDIERTARFTTPVRWIGVYMFLLALLLAVAWTAQWAHFVAAGSLRAEEGNFIRTVGGVDISFLASGLVLGAVWLLRRQAWGYVVATMLNVCFTVEMLALTVGAFPKAEVGLWIPLGIASLSASLMLLGGLRPAASQ